MIRSFASDNNAPIAPEILEAIVGANEGDTVGYGDDPYTEKARERFRETFGPSSEVYFVFNGTGANVVSLSAFLKPYEAVITPVSSHLNTAECGALERFCGCRVIALPANDGKLQIEELRPFAGRSIDEHESQVRAISITQCTEYGTLYRVEELRQLCDFAHGQGWYVHMDGARLSNAAAAQGLTLREATAGLGIDVLSFGGTKNGLLGGEAVVFFNKELHA